MAPAGIRYFAHQPKGVPWRLFCLMFGVHACDRFARVNLGDHMIPNRARSRDAGQPGTLGLDHPLETPKQYYRDSFHIHWEYCWSVSSVRYNKQAAPSSKDSGQGNVKVPFCCSHNGQPQTAHEKPKKVGKRPVLCPIMHRSDQLQR